MSRFPLLLSLTVTVASIPLIAQAVDVPEVSGPPVTVQPGEVRKSLRLRDGREVPQSGRLIDDATLEVTREDGCSWTVATDDIYGPSLSWNNCNPGPWGTGKAENVRREGQLWPLKVGNKVKYRFHNVNSKGKVNRNAFRNCEVEDKVMVTAAGVEYPSYKVHCHDHAGTRTFYYSPEVGGTVYAEQHHKKNGKRNMEFVKWM
jgi:hypothetical protein